MICEEYPSSARAFGMKRHSRETKAATWSSISSARIDVPALEDDQSPIPPFDLSRSMRLNRENALVQAVYAFVGEKLDRVVAS